VREREIYTLDDLREKVEEVLARVRVPAEAHLMI